MTLVTAYIRATRVQISARQAEGIAQAKAKGVYRGRSKSLTPEQVKEARGWVAAGVPLSRVAREAGVSRSVMSDAVKGRGAYAEADHLDVAREMAP